ncbi:uncharacterized protein LOC130123772 [Lampris incognitus]|uniref:uncharacterized protein LOC130123772 n=1 Tax=Lampris incognitus TaxID=2546036 RepID=UPI0024B58ED0|nr:uncharacterized protein LOC130123772 [Lampris incognitus]
MTLELQHDKPTVSLKASEAPLSPDTKTYFFAGYSKDDIKSCTMNNITIKVYEEGATTPETHSESSTLDGLHTDPETRSESSTLDGLHTEGNYEPSYYLLSVSNDTQACLATDFTSYNATQDVFGNAAEATRPNKDSFYSRVALFSPGEFNCPEKEKTCDADIFEPDEKVNFLALVMQGLRLIFIKTVVFNVLMMLQLWRSYTQ